MVFKHEQNIHSPLVAVNTLTKTITTNRVQHKVTHAYDCKILALMMLASHPANVLHTKIQAARPTSALLGSSTIQAFMLCNTASVMTVALIFGALPYTELASKVIATTAQNKFVRLHR
jgi:hypothetical protein